MQFRNMLNLGTQVSNNINSRVYIGCHLFSCFYIVVLLQNVNDLKKVDYENLLHKLIRKSQLVNHTKSPCEYDFVPSNVSQQYVAYFGWVFNGRTLKYGRTIIIYGTDTLFLPCFFYKIIFF